MMISFGPSTILDSGTCIGMTMGAVGIAGRDFGHPNILVIDWRSICRHRCVTRAGGGMLFMIWVRISRTCTPRGRFGYIHDGYYYWLRLIALGQDNGLEYPPKK